MAVGIIAEYNPFHNGHLYHLKKVKEMFQEEVILILSGNFTQRGDLSLLDKWQKTEIALEYGVDLVVELPFCYACEGADLFSKGAISLLNKLQVDKLVFGSECDDVHSLTKLATIQEQEDYQILVKRYLKEKQSYPASIGNAFKDLTGVTFHSPNDILGVSYIREIIQTKSAIIPYTIKRTNDYHSKELDSKIASATSIRDAIHNHKDISPYVPEKTLSYIKTKEVEFFPYLKYKILSEKDLTVYQGMDISLEKRFKKEIESCDSLDSFIKKVKNKKETYSSIKRTCIHILCDYKKEEAKKQQSYSYLRILGFNETGKNYLKKIKKEITPILTSYKKEYDSYLSLEQRVSQIYYFLKQEKSILEHQKKVIYKES